MKIKFAHVSDVHLGAWRNESLNLLGYKAFTKTVDKILEEKVDFVIISGDLYDISNPKVDVVDVTVQELKRLYDAQIPVYGIMGSHDFSPSEKSMIRPLKSAGFFTDISKGEFDDDNKLHLRFTEDKNTKIKLTGLRARKRSLEIEDYRLLHTGSLEKEEGPKIFVLHTMLQELKPLEYKDMESAPKSVLPKGFQYYAGGHLHKTVPESLRTNGKLLINEKNNIIYPGCLFPTNFLEVEKFHHGGFCIVSGEFASLEVDYVPVEIKDVVNFKLDCNNKSVQEVLSKLDNFISTTDLNDKLITLRIFGTLSSGKPYEIKTNEIVGKIKDKGAYEVLLNKSALLTKEFSSIRVLVGKTNEEIENTLIHEHAEKSEIKDISKKQLEDRIHKLLLAIGVDREEGTNVGDYKDGLIQNFIEIFNLKKEG